MFGEDLKGREVMKIKKWPLFTAITLVVAIGSIVTGCRFRGTSYLALDYTTYEPTSAYFPALPDPFYWTTYYEHPEGTYYGEYTNWDASLSVSQLYTFNYTIEVNQGFLPDDRYYTMYLDPGGPELHYINVAAALAGKGLKSATHNRSILNAPIDRSLYDLANPEPFSYERSSDGITFRVTGNRYSKK
jgi:hypothetical protein